jgi:hypothetical protein
MIFLVVTLGFFAENIREDFTQEKMKANQYLETNRDELVQQHSLLMQYKKIYQEKLIVFLLNISGRDPAEKHREREYIISIIEDLKADTANIVKHAKVQISC